MTDTSLITISKDTANASLTAIGIAIGIMTADGTAKTRADAKAAVQAMQKAQIELMGQVSKI